MDYPLRFRLIAASGARLMFMLLLVLMAIAASAQNLNQKVTLQVSDAPLETVLQQLKADYGLQLAYNVERIQAQEAVSLDVKNKRLEDVLNQLLANTTLAWLARDGKIYLRPSSELGGDAAGWTIPAESIRYTVSGHVVDQETGEALIGATVKRANSSTGTTANQYGFFSLTLPRGNHQLECRYLGFKTQTLPVSLKEDYELKVAMLPNLEQLEEVLIDNEDLTDPKAVSASMLRMPMKQVEELPGLMGTKDIINSVQNQPGIGRKNEGTSGFFVRGGNLDQNLILIDEAPVYNESHLLGLISVFNWNTIQSCLLYTSPSPRDA